MDTHIVCPHCKKQIPLTQALSHKLKEQYQVQMEEEKRRIIATYQKKLSEEKLQIEKETEEQLKQKIQREMELKFKDAHNELEELRRQNKTLQEQVLETNKLLRQLRSERESEKIEYEKKLFIEQEKMRSEEKKRLEEEYALKLREKDKKIEDAMNRVKEMERKLGQESQQMQGEVLEAELEARLKREFLYDEIQPVPKGVRGADIIQIVKNNSGKPCGSIIWESKRTKAWSEGWIDKLREDQRQVKAEAAVIISNILPEGIKVFGLKDGVWVGNYESIIGLGVALRNSLIEIATVKSSIVGRQDKMEVLWEYLTGVEFKQRVEAIYDAYIQLKDDLEKEKRWFTLKWAKQEKNIQRVSDQMLSMHGDLQSIVGKALSEVKGFDLLPDEI